LALLEEAGGVTPEIEQAVREGLEDGAQAVRDDKKRQVPHDCTEPRGPGSAAALFCLLTFDLQVVLAGFTEVYGSGPGRAEEQSLSRDNVATLPNPVVAHHSSSSEASRQFDLEVSEPRGPGSAAALFCLLTFDLQVVLAGFTEVYGR
jgi:hypothetical protein